MVRLSGRLRVSRISMRWGLIPAWWKKTAKEAPSTFNARAETVASKPMFRAALPRRKGLCLVLSSSILRLCFRT